MKTMYIINEERCEICSTRPIDVSDKNAFIKAYVDDYFDKQGYSWPSELSRFDDLERAKAEFNALTENSDNWVYLSRNGKKYIASFTVITLEAEHLDDDGEIDYVETLKQDII